MYVCNCMGGVVPLSRRALLQDASRELDPLDPSATVPADDVSEASIAVRRLQRWRSATNKARAAVRLSRSMQAAKGDAPPPDPAADDLVQEIAAKYCYPIAEQPDAAAAVEGGACDGEPAAAEAKRRRKQCKWRCPLSCRPEELPEGAKLHGCLLDMGEAPDMKSCKGIWAGGGSYRNPDTSRARQGGAAAPGEAVPAAAPEAADVSVALSRRPAGPECVSGGSAGGGAGGTAQGAPAGAADGEQREPGRGTDDDGAGQGGPGQHRGPQGASGGA